MDNNEEVVEQEEKEATEQLENNDLENQPDLEDPAFVDSDNKKDTSSQKALNALAKKVLFEYIKKNPIVLGIIIGVVIFFIFIFILLGLDFDFAGEGNTEADVYPLSCNNIYLTWENEAYIKEHQDVGDYIPATNPADVDISDTTRYSYSTYSFDTYISGIVWNDNNSAGDVKNETVYELMGVAARSRVVSSLTDNCVVLRDHNPENFIELNGSESKYKQITSAVSKSEGMIIGKNNQILNAKYDAFSYTKKSQENEPDKEAVGSYYMMNESVEGQQLIPASWVVEKKLNQEIMQKVKKSTKYESMSLYGAKYLLEKADSQYDLYRVLRYYYGSDIKYYKIASHYENSYIGGCFWWPIGSDTTSVENGITYAKDDPATTTITSQFGYRKSPLAGASTYHKAIDIGGGVELKTNIISAEDGKVTKTIKGCVVNATNCGGGLGNAVYIEHNDGTITRYGHMSIVSVNQGDTVKKGQVIGKMGNTGNSTGPHLDFQVQVNGTPINPLSYVSATDPRGKNCLSISTGTYTGGSNQDFINFFAPPAIQSMHTSQILASVTIAQAALESGWGTSTLSKNYNNYFGMKAGSYWSGRTVNLPTTEWDSTRGYYQTIATWRVYDNALQSIDDHAKLLQNSRYNGVVGEKDYVRAITIIKNGGYAKDPDYISKIVNLIRTYNLDKFDRM